MSNFIFTLGIGVLCHTISNKIQVDSVGVMCVLGAFMDFWSYLFGGNNEQR